MMKGRSKSKIVTTKLVEDDYGWLVKESEKEDRTICAIMRIALKEYRRSRDPSGEH